MQGKINDDYLVVLKAGPNAKYLKVDFLTIEKLFEAELAEFRSALKSSTPVKNILSQFKDFHYLLNYYDYCEVIANPYQGLANYSNYKGIRYLLTCLNENLEMFVTTRLKAYRIEKAYSMAGSLIEKEKILAFSHRKVGWSAKPFRIGNIFEITFNTNFGYGYVSYFYLVIKYRDILIIPYSDWIIYNNAGIYEIQSYTRKYKLKDESWVQAMEECRILYNLAVSDEDQFIEKYITQEAIKMVEGLKKILQYNEFKLLDLNRDVLTLKKEGYQIIEYRAEKVSGALKFISNLNNFKAKKGISEIIKEIKTLNKEIIPVIKRELELINKRLDDIEPELLRLAPIVEMLKERSYNILTTHNKINDELHKKYKNNYGKKDRIEEKERLLTKELPNWKAHDNEYFEIHNCKYNPLKIEVGKLKLSKKAIERFLNEIENYFKNN